MVRERKEEGVGEAVEGTEEGGGGGGRGEGEEGEGEGEGTTVRRQWSGHWQLSHCLPLPWDVRTCNERCRVNECQPHVTLHARGETSPPPSKYHSHKHGAMPTYHQEEPKVGAAG